MKKSCLFSELVFRNTLGAAVLFLMMLFLFPPPARALGQGDISPDFKVVTIDGKELSYGRDFRGKRPVYLIFWATW